MQDQTGQHSEYDLSSVNVPYMVGLPLRLMAALLESPLRRLLAPILLDNMGITWFRAQQFEEPPTFYPITVKGKPGSDSERVPQREWPALPAKSGPGFRFATVLDSLFPLPAHLTDLLTDETVLCRCEEITVGEVRRAVAEGATTVSAVRMLTRAGMGRCQGRMCGSSVAELLARELGQTVEAGGQATPRPPVIPIPLDGLLDQEGA